MKEGRKKIRLITREVKRKLTPGAVFPDTEFRGKNGASGLLYDSDPFDLER
jgi:hypothetical protein